MTFRDLDTAQEFEAPFWSADFEIALEDLPGPLSVARMILANKYVPHDPDRFHKNAVAIADDFVKLMQQIP